jgi:hypothetical protein
MIVEMGDYAWSEHIVTVFLACQITIKNVQVQLTVKGKTTPENCATLFTARGSSDKTMACDVARHEPYRACMGLYLPKN